jgi:hypothetical protein
MVIRLDISELTEKFGAFSENLRKKSAAPLSFGFVMQDRKMTEI